jgi:hypothetical protein
VRQRKQFQQCWRGNTFILFTITQYIPQHWCCGFSIFVDKCHAIRIAEMNHNYSCLMGGNPTICGMRFRVSDVFDLLASGMTNEEMPDDFPY